MPEPRFTARCGHPFDAEEMAAQERSNDVDEGIDDTNLMKQHVRGLDAMGESFRLRQALEHVTALLFDRRRHPAGGDDTMDAAE